MNRLIPGHTRRLRWRRPEASLEMMVLAVCVFLALVTNGAFWSAVRATGVLEGTGGVRLGVSLFAAIVALHAMVFLLVLNRWTVKPVLTLLLLVSSATAHFASTYAVYVDPSMVRNVLRTDAAEAGELLTPQLGLWLLLGGLLPATALWAARIRIVSWRRALLRRSLTVLALAILAAVAITASFQDLASLMRNHKALRYLITPGNALVSSARVLSENANTPRGPRRAVGIDARQGVHPPTAKPHLLVIVVGETVRARNWGLNGYARQTTPQLARLGVVNFTDVSACGSNTEVSVPCMFSATGRRDYDRAAITSSDSLLHVLERAGIATLWRDNQTGCKGVCEGLAFESYRLPRADPLCSDGACRDAVMLRGLHEAIRRNPGDTVVVLHQLGNHGPSYYRRYPAELRRFRPDCNSNDLGSCTRAQIVNAYDNAVLATDDFLAKTIRMLAADRTHNTAMIYVSDHGESLGEGNLYLHGLPYAIATDEQLKVPMVAWLSDGMIRDSGMDMTCLRNRAREPASHDNLFHSVLGLMQVSTRTYDSALDVFHTCIRSGR